MKQIDEVVQALVLKKRKKKITRQIPQGQYAYCKYLEIIRVWIFESEQKQNAAVAGGLSKNNKSPPQHSGWRLKNLITARRPITLS